MAELLFLSNYVIADFESLAQKGIWEHCAIRTELIKARKPKK
jgi:hypothetical protein